MALRVGGGDITILQEHAENADPWAPLYGLVLLLQKTQVQIPAPISGYMHIYHMCKMLHHSCTLRKKQMGGHGSGKEVLAACVSSVLRIHIRNQAW